jgi:ABC-type multidrug transport system fused ATPase/permease subunit
MDVLRSARFLLSNKFSLIIPMVIIFLISSALDLAGIALIGGYIGVIIEPSLIIQIKDKFLTFQFFNNFSSEEILLFFGYLLFLTFVIKFIFTIFTNFLIFKFANLEMAKIQKLMIRSFLDQEYEKFILSKSSDDLASISNYSGGYKEFLVNSLQFLSSILVIIAASILLAVISFEVVFWMLLIVGTILILYNLYFSKKINTFGQEFTDGATELIQATQESADGIKEIKTLGAEEVFVNTVSNAANKIAKGHIGLNIASILPRHILEVILIGCIVLIISKDIFLGQDVSSTLIILGSFAAAMVRITPLVSQVQTSLNAIAYQSPSVLRLAEIIQDKGVNLDADLSELSQQSFEVSDKYKQNSFEQLKLENVSYAYPKSSKISIKPTNIEINKGDFVGIIGPSGAGKTTLVDIILGFLKPTSGFLKFNNEDAHQDIKKLLMLCAYLPQDIFLIHGTIKENITMQNSNISNEKMANIIKSSNLEEFLHDLPDGLDTHIGDKGVRLSGGQKQRVSIARALYFERDILIMDESTSALDSKTEEIFINELSKLREKKTIISIAHRISTLKDCNKIYTVNNGEVKGPFTFDEIK